ncbi:DnaJ domain-containing protein [Candidatus Poribacteria bacterium]|nr:DnaJ domain-containing protein [Candidatus Poribacteria bacterium]
MEDREGKIENPYEILGLDRNASQEEIRRAYFDLVKRFTPERDSEKFKEIRAAYEQLRDLRKRVEADMFIFSEPFKEFELYGRNERSEYKPKLDLNLVLKSLFSESLELSRTDFSDDFQDVDLKGSR